VSRSAWGRLLGWTIAGAGLAWVGRELDRETLLAALVGMRWSLVAAAVGADLLAYVCQGWRWRILLAGQAPISVFDTTRAVYAGLFANEVLPLRVGEVGRAWLVARRLGTGLLPILGTVAVERLLDGAWLLVATGAVAPFVPLPAELERVADVLAVVVLAAGAALALLAWRRPRRPRAGARLAAAFAVSAGVPGFQMLGFWLMLRAYGIEVAFPAAAAALLVVLLGTALPNAPGNIGSWQLFAVLGLGLVGVDRATAAGFSVIGFALLTIPLWLLGAAALASSGESVRELRADAVAALFRARSRNPDSNETRASDVS